MSDLLVPRDHAEQVALFRAQVIGALARSLYWFGVNETALVAGYAGKR